MDSLNQQLEWLEQVKNQMEEEKTALESRIKEETKAREKAIAKSEANSLSRLYCECTSGKTGAQKYRRR